MIKRIGTEARHDLEKFFGTKVFLDLRVKVNAAMARQRARRSTTSACPNATVQADNRAPTPIPTDSGTFSSRPTE